MALMMFAISILNRMENTSRVTCCFRNSILIFVLAFPTICFSQNPRFDHIGTREGLSQINVTCIIQEDRGFIWVGTDDGLNRYDGYQFITYRYNSKDSNSLSNSFVGNIKQDREGNLWIPPEMA